MEIIIDVRDMLAELIRKLWFIVVLIVVCALAICGFKYYKDCQAAKAGESMTEMEELTVDEQVEVDAYIGMKNQLEYQMDYVNDSILMSIDPYHFYKTDIQYYIDDATDVSSADLMYAYQFYILKGGLVSDLYKADDSVETAYLQELISMVEISGSDNFIRNVMNITLYGKTQKDAEDLADRVKQQVEQYHSVVSDTLGAHSLVFLNESTKMGSDSGIANAQTNVLNSLLSQKKNVESAKEELSGAQLAEVEAIESEASVDGGDNSDRNNISDVHISKKYLAAGALAGLVLGIILVLLGYLFSNTIKGARDLQKMQGLNFLGSVSIRKKSVLDKVANKIFGREPLLNHKVEQKLLESKLFSCCKNHSITTVALTGDENLRDSEPIKALLNNFAEKDIDVVWIGDLSENPEAVEQLENYHNVVLVEQLKKSRYESVFYKIKLCEDQGVDIFGYITIA